MSTLLINRFLRSNQFDTSASIYKPPVARSEAANAAPLQPKATMEIGYGSDGWNPLTYTGDPRTEVAILRLFISTRYIDLDSLEQESPFTKDHRFPDNSLTDLFDGWDVVTMGLAVRRV